MQERNNVITFKGSALTLLGDELAVGSAAPGFSLLTTELGEASLGDWKGQPMVVASVPSLDTSVCSLEMNRFNKELAERGVDIPLVTVSMDLPFAQARWQQEHGADRLTLLSDHREGSFGMAWGLLIKELRLLARAVYVLDASHTVVHAQLVQEMTDEPDYDAVLAALPKG